MGQPRPVRPPESLRRVARPLLSTQYATIDTEALLAVAREMGKIIAAEMRKAQSITQVHHSVPIHHTSIDSQAIDIDESLIDVGIGAGEELKRGEGSASLEKTEVASDQGLHKSRSKLRAFKGGKA